MRSLQIWTASVPITAEVIAADIKALDAGQA
jgi:hypothetical protein